MSEVLSGAEFKRELREGKPKLGIFVNSHSPQWRNSWPIAVTIGCWWIRNTDQWDTKPIHDAGGYRERRRQIVGSRSRYQDRPGIQQSLDTGADGILVPYINTAEEQQAISCARYPTSGTRSVYFPQRSMNKKGLLG